MGLLQAAYRTYEVQSHRAGIIEEGKEPLTPIAHIVQNAQIEITIGTDGQFQAARQIPKEEKKTIIPATIESANRVGDNDKAHPLSDQLRYLSSYGGSKFIVYVAHLEQWVQSEYTHPKAAAVLDYVTGGTILHDLATAGIIALQPDGTPDKGGIEGNEYDRCMVRWRVNPSPDGVSSACWQDVSLFNSFAALYHQQCGEVERDLCYITGEQDMVCEMHPKGVVPSSYGAKLVSANDGTGFTYRGRFVTSRQACSVGYTSSQKAHNALRWVVSNDGVIMGGRTFICWNPEGYSVPQFAFLGLPSKEPQQYASYKQELLETLGGYRQRLGDSHVVVAALEAATTGRLSVTYYNEQRGADFVDRVEQWYTTCCWETRQYGVQSPTLRRIVSYAFGTEQGQYVTADDRVLREHVQQLLPCIVDCKPVPQDVVRALVARAATPMAYSPANRENLLVISCALVRKYRNDSIKKEEWTLALDTTNANRSYLFGRLLAVAEQVERSTYGRDEGREPNAIRLQSEFTRRPMHMWKIIEDKLNPYYARLNPGLRAYFKNIIGEATDKLDIESPDLGSPLEDVYLLGYYHQRSALTHKKEIVETEVNKDEHTEE